MIPDVQAAHSKFQSGAPGLAYNEAAFRHFLAVDRSRARRSHRRLYLVLIALREGIGRRATLTDATAAAIFRGLGASVREVDFVGWYEEGRVAGAVLSQGAKTTDAAAVAISDRVLLSLRKQLPAPHSTNLRVRVVRLGSSAAIAHP